MRCLLLLAVIRRGMGVLNAAGGSLRAVACPANFYGELPPDHHNVTGIISSNCLQIFTSF
jgi:hypothetical protein